MWFYSLFGIYTLPEQALHVFIWSMLGSNSSYGQRRREGQLVGTKNWHFFVRHLVQQQSFKVSFKGSLTPSDGVGRSDPFVIMGLSLELAP